MKEQLTIFESAQFGQIRTSKSASGEPLFCLTDVCQALDLKNPSKVKTRLSQKGLTSSYTLTAGGEQQLLFIDEPNLYKCIFQSRKKEAEQFQDWVCSVVLPSIRKTGSYTALLAKSRESREDGVYDADYPTLEDYFRKYVPAEYFVNMLFSIMKEYSSMADILPEEADNAYHKINVLLTFTNTLAANHRRGAFA